MIEVKAYRCPHCNKIFKVRKHFCWKDTANKACTTCEGWPGWEHDSVPYKTPAGVANKTHYFAVCTITNLLIYESHSTSSEVEFGAYHGNRGYMCPHWIERGSVKEEDNMGGEQ